MKPTPPSSSDVPGGIHHPYRTGECVFEGAKLRVFVARRSSDDAPVMLKQLRELYPSPNVLARLTREFEITRAAAGEGVIVAHEIYSQDGAVSLVFEDMNGRSLSSICAAGRIALTDVLRVGIQIAIALSRIHRLDIVHRDVNPSNIVWCRENGVAKLIDFSIAQVLGRESVHARPLARVEGTPAYMSPEQTGRMNRLVDRRSDLYSLGATLYELISGQPPFVGDTRLELVHGHLAKTPSPPHRLDPCIPEALSNVVLRLLNKRAEDRYQSATGLRVDLEHCLAQLEQTGRIEPFELGRDDLDDRLRLPQKLYGRDAPIERLLAVFEQAVTGRLRVLLVSGHSGIGKTSLVHELHRSLPGRGAVFVEGKFDQFDRGTPYQPFLQVFRGILARILTEESTRIEVWKARILEAVGDNGAVLIDVLPEVERVIGPQPPLEPLTPAEARNRFQRAMASFVRAMSPRSRPLVLFFDDLQWADLPSIELIGNLAADPECRHVLFVGAFRENEIDAVHPLAHAITTLTSEGALIDRIELSALDEETVVELVSDVVAGVRGHRELAAICHARTLGNPFYLGRLLGSLFDEGLLRFDRDAREWRWDLDAVRSRSVTENVVEHLSTRILRLPETTRRALELAACIGDTFDLATLSLVLESSRKATLTSLGPALAAELVQPSEGGFWFVRDVDEAHTDFTCRFVHDRIRQAARSLLDETTAAEIHLRLGRLLLARLDPTARHQRLFELVEHMNRGASLIVEPAERDRLADLNLEAGRRALASAAFQPAHGYYQHAHRHLAADAWTVAYPKALAIHVEGARAAYLSGHHDEMDALVQIAIERGRALLDRVQAQEVKIYALVAAQRLLDAVQLALAVLAQLGVRHPLSPTDADNAAAIGTTIDMIGDRRPDAIVSLPRASDPIVVAAARIQNALMTSAYLAVPKLLPLLASHIVQTTMIHGVCKESPYGFAIFALVLTAMNRIDLAYSTGHIALRMLDTIDDRSVRAKPLHVVSCHVKPFVDPLRESLENCRHVFQIGMDTGDLEYAAWALHNMCCNGFYAGIGVDEMSTMIDRNLALLEQHRQLPAIACTLPYRQAIANLRGKAGEPSRLTGPGYDERKQMDSLVASGFRGAAFILTTIGCYLRYLFRDLHGAVSFADAGGLYADGATATQHQVWWHQYRTLAMLGGIESGSNRAPRVLAAIEPSLAQLRIWRRFSPINHAHRLDLIEAEIARVEARIGDAVELYDRAIAQAHGAGFAHEEALANELAARFHLDRGSRTTARAYLMEARYAYERWGALAKIEQLEEEFAELIAGFGWTAPVSVRRSMLPETPSTVEGDDALDLRTLFKAANLIASETRLETLLARVLGVVIENAGATRGFMIVDHDGDLVVEAARDVEGHDLISPGCRVADCEGLPSTVVNYVARTGERLVLTDARDDARWAADPRIVRGRPTSVLCAPLVHNSVRNGIIYVENHLTAGAFTPARTQMLELLSTQAAISIDNARLYDTLEQRVRERTRELQASLALVVEGQRRLAGELSEAAAYIRSLLPRKLKGRLSLDWRFLPSAELGGDAFGYHFLPDGRLSLYLLDVCGHGMASALLSISVLSSLSSQRLTGVDFGDPTDVLRGLNAAFPSEQHGGLFFTAWYGVLDQALGEIRFASAGHPPAILFTGPSRDRMRAIELGTDGPMIGVSASASFPSGVASLDGIARLFVFSDGVYELEQQDGTLLPYERFVTELTQLTSRVGDETDSLDRMVAFAYRVRGRDTLDDDFSMVELSLQS